MKQKDYKNYSELELFFELKEALNDLDNTRISETPRDIMKEYEYVLELYEEISKFLKSNKNNLNNSKKLRHYWYNFYHHYVTNILTKE